MSSSSITCNHCGASEETKTLLLCGGCKAVYYCSRDCQASDRKKHKSACRRAKKSNAAAPSNQGSTSSNSATPQRPSSTSVLSDLATTNDDRTWLSFLQKDTTIEEARKLPQVIMQAWYVKLCRYWTHAGEEWFMLEVLNTSPLIRDELDNHLLMYREPWRPPRQDDGSLFVDRLVKILLTVMAEGGNVAAPHTSCENRAQLNKLPSDYFLPRRPGILTIDEKLQRWFDPIQSRLGKQLNMLMRLFPTISTSGDAPSWAVTTSEEHYKLYETQDNTVLEPRIGGLRIRCLSRQERQAAFAADRYAVFEDIANDYLYPPAEELTEKTPNWERYGYTSLEEAMSEYCQDTSNEEERKRWEKELSEEEPVWKECYGSLEEACMDNYETRTIEEAVWDYAGTPRLLCVGDENAGDKLRAAGWRCVGHRPGKDFELGEGSLKYGQRVVLDERHVAWEEGSRC